MMTLEQHLRDASCSSKVSINLERRMQIEQIVLRVVRQQQLDILARLLAILQTCVEIDHPGSAPPCVGAVFLHLVVVAPSGDGLFSRLEQLLSGRIDGGARIESEQMGDVTMPRLHLLIVRDPFLNGAIALADTDRR